jgi:hypothetical protein
MVETDAVPVEHREHPRYPGRGLIVEIAGQQYDVLDISFGGIKVNGRVAVAGGLLSLVILPTRDNTPMREERAEVRGRVVRVDGNLTAIQFSNRTNALIKLIGRRLTMSS